jgi:hypothetical protein
MHSHICIVAHHIGALAETCEGHDVELNPKMVLVDPSRRLKDRTSAIMEDAHQRVHLTNTDLSRIPGKPRSIISLLPSKQLIIYMLYILLH